MKHHLPASRAVLAGAVLALILAACGGGGGGDTGSTSTGLPAGDTGATAAPLGGAPDAGTESQVQPACAGCGAIDARTYAGAGVGIWEKSNTTGAALDVPVSISGLSGQDVMLVFTNESPADVAMPAINIATPGAQEIRKDLPLHDGEDPHAAFREFNQRGWAERVGAPDDAILPKQAPLSASYAEGATRQFYHSDQTRRTATLLKQLAAGDGVQVNLWVESAEIGQGKVTPALAERLADSFARSGGIYDMLKAAGGPLWGPHRYAELIPGTGQPLDIVVLNFDRNQRPYGMVGYFWSLHQFTRAADARSNQSVSMYLDAETLYLAGERGVQVAQMTLAHEGMHMSNFYRRGVGMGPQYQFDTWLEEMTAMMMEDAAASRIDAGYHPTRDLRLHDYLTLGSYNCALRQWTPFAGACESYAVSGSFGGFLLRQLGVGFYQALLHQKVTGSEAALESAIRSARPGSGLGQQLRFFAASAIPTLPAAAPVPFGYPARSEGGFDIPAIDASALKAARQLPSELPASLLAYANYPVVRRALSGTYSETVRVPAGATLSVVIH